MKNVGKFREKYPDAVFFIRGEGVYTVQYPQYMDRPESEIKFSELDEVLPRVVRAGHRVAIIEG